MPADAVEGNGPRMRKGRRVRSAALLCGRPARARRGACLLAALAAACLGGAASAAASPSASLVVIPRPSSQPGLSYFKLTARPGFSGSIGAIELRNPTGAQLRVVLSRVDGRTLSTLGSAYAPPGSRPHDSTRWLSLGESSVALAPGASAVVPVSVQVPRGGSAGDHLAGVSIEALDQLRLAVPTHGTSVASVERYAIGVEVTLPGPRTPALGFTGASVERQPAGVVFLLHARNTGNVVLQGVHGGVRVTRDGHTILSRAIEAGTFVTASSIDYPVTAFGQEPPEGARYRVSAWMSYPGGIARLDQTVTFGRRAAAIEARYGGHPVTAASAGGTAWWKIAGALAVVLYALLTTALLLRRRGRERELARRAQLYADPVQASPDQLHAARVVQAEQQESQRA
jgi:hypothetical protein